MYWNQFHCYPYWPVNFYGNQFGNTFTQSYPIIPQNVQNGSFKQTQEQFRAKQEQISDSPINDVRMPIPKPKRKKNLSQIQQDQYLPPAKLSKRNKNSNVLKLFIRHVKKVLEKTNRLQLILRAKDLSPTVAKDFICQFNKIFIECRNYARPKKIKELLCKQDPISMVLRILFHQFYRTEIYRIILRKSTLSKKAKTDYIKICRKLANELLQ